MVKALVILLCLLFVSQITAHAAISLFMGPTQITGIAEPLANGGSLLVHVDLLRHVGAEIITQNAQRVHFRYNHYDVTIQADSNMATVNGSEYAMSTKAVSHLGVLFIPLNFLADILSLRVSWDQADAALHLNARSPGNTISVDTLGPPQPIVLETSPGNKVANSPNMHPVIPPSLAVPVPQALPTGKSATTAPAPVAVTAPTVPPANVTPVTVATPPQAVVNTATTPSTPVVTQSATTAVVDAATPIAEQIVVEPTNIMDTFTDTPVERIWPGQGDQSLTMFSAPEANAPLFVLLGIKQEQLTVGYLPAPHRLVIDIDGFMPKTGLEPWNLAYDNVIRVRVAPYQGKGRVVLDLNYATSYQVESHPEGVIIRLNRRLTQVDFTVEPLGGHLSLDLPANTPYSAYQLSEPDRWVVDLPHTTLVGGTRQMQADKGPIKAVRVSQFDASTTRIVFDMVGKATIPFVVSTERLEFVLQSQVNRISLVDLDSSRQMIVIEGSGQLKGNIFTLQQPNRLVIDLENASTPYYFGEVQINRGFIQTLRAAQFQPDTVRIVANVQDRLRAHFVELGMGKVGILLESPTIIGSRIVIDAGHGGSDPGAIGRVLGVREADVNLAIATQLGQLLSQANASVHLTRTSDSHLFLSQRPVISKSFDPDIFVSIHANSTLQGQSALGTETLYWNLLDESRLLAESIQQELVSVTGTVDRGVKQQNLLVLREATVPAVLVEVAFLSHPEEEAKLADPQFQKLVAQGIYNGIVRFHEQNTQNHLTRPYKIDADWENDVAGSRVYLPIVEPPLASVNESTPNDATEQNPVSADVYVAYSEAEVRAERLQSGLLP
jgi:N-acetylmuramoyl-L-alanine amidase